MVLSAGAILAFYPNRDLADILDLDKTADNLI